MNVERQGGPFAPILDEAIYRFFEAAVPEG
jgi:hypothetical protein